MAMKQSVRWLALLCVAGVLSAASAQLRRRINPSECFVDSRYSYACFCILETCKRAPPPLLSFVACLWFLAGAGQLINCQPAPKWSTSINFKNAIFFQPLSQLSLTPLSTEWRKEMVTLLCVYRARLDCQSLWIFS